MAPHSYLGFHVHLRLSNISFLCNLRFLVYKHLSVPFAHFSIGRLIFSMSDWSSFILWILTLCWLQLLRILCVTCLCSQCLLITVLNATWSNGSIFPIWWIFLFCFVLFSCLFPTLHGNRQWFRCWVISCPGSNPVSSSWGFTHTSHLPRPPWVQRHLGSAGPVDSPPSGTVTSSFFRSRILFFPLVFIPVAGLAGMLVWCVLRALGLQDASMKGGPPGASQGRSSWSRFSGKGLQGKWGFVREAI